MTYEPFITIDQEQFDESNATAWKGTFFVAHECYRAKHHINVIHCTHAEQRKLNESTFDKEHHTSETHFFWLAYKMPFLA